MNEKYLNSTAEDYVIETHVNSGWAYKKWFAGESEAWGSFTIKPTYTSIEGSVRYYNVSVALPKGVFISTPVVIATPVSYTHLSEGTQWPIFQGRLILLWQKRFI